MAKNLIFFFILLSFSGFAQRKTISGYIYEKGSRESLVGVNVYNPDSKQGSTSNIYGFYSLSLNVTDSVLIRWSYVGYQTIEKKVLLNENLHLNIFLESSLELQEVVISGEREQKISEEVRMSVVGIKPQDIKAIPALLGEKDVFKALQLMPGVQKGTEGSSGIYVRGGGPDQNLIILDEAIVYNANHLFGFFSIFNGDALKSIELTKGGFPARYGGRLSSVIEMTMKDGNKQKFAGEAGVGIISARLLLEGPIVKDKSSFIISGRRTYIDFLMQPIIAAQSGGSSVGYYFYDLNAKANYDFGNKNKLFLSGYFGRDKFYMNEKMSLENRLKAGLFWQNSTATLRWNHLFHNTLFSNASFIFSDYTMKIYAEEKSNNDLFSMQYISGINDYGLKYDLYYHPSPNHSIRAGINSIYHVFVPGAFVLKNDFVEDDIKMSKREEGVETSIYMEDEIKTLNNKLRLNPGVRLTSFMVKDKHYISPEPRFSSSYLIKPDLALKASFASMSQFLHLLSNTGIGLPTDLWVPSTPNIKPQKSWQVAAGIGKDFLKNDVSLTIEGYYKKSDHIIGYKEGASFIGISQPGQRSEFNWEQNITTGQAWSYGLEILFRKNSGRFTGWM
ncbi:MAG: TonB-dependent receptor, partial [Bacteroidales bacterium]|nr:TonB-dependent receptor [Bacteroidales bacterium]